MKTYRIHDHRGNLVAPRATLEEAAHYLLTGNAHDYQIRQVDLFGYRLYRINPDYEDFYTTQIFSIETDKEKATQDIFQQVLSHQGWFPYFIATELKGE